MVAPRHWASRAFRLGAHARERARLRAVVVVAGTNAAVFARLARRSAAHRARNLVRFTRAGMAGEVHRPFRRAPWPLRAAAARRRTRAVVRRAAPSRTVDEGRL